MVNPTRKQYEDFSRAYTLFNAKLFAGTLPDCLITMQRKARSYGYFAGGRFGATDGSHHADEIALNPAHFKDRSTEEVLSTLAHEMVHLWQHHCGTPSQTGYHNKEWAAKMEEIGLVPSHTGEVGGKKTGQNMSHFIKHQGRFKEVCAELINTGFVIPYVDTWEEEETRKTARKKKAASKTRYTCPDCDLNIWGKPDIKVICGECMQPMLAPEA